MASLVLTGDTSGSLTVSAPAIAGSNTQTLVATTGTLAPIVSGTAVASTSGTSIDFTGIPSWVKRITVMFNGVSLSGTSGIIIQIGASSFTTSGYISSGSRQINNTSLDVGSYTTGFGIDSSSAANLIFGSFVLTNMGSNIWTCAGLFNSTTGQVAIYTTSGSVALAGTLDRVRNTTFNGTDTFDAGSINILYE